MKILYCNPVFLDYRLPFYKKLVELFKGDFHVMYSPTRYHLMKRDDLCERIKREMGDNAHPFNGDYMFDTATMSFKRMEMEHGQKLSFTLGLIRFVRKIRPNVLISEAFFQWTPLCLIYSTLFRIPLYIGYERTCYTERNAGRLKTLYRKLVDKFITGYFVNGSETRKYLESIGISNKKIHIVGMSADSVGLTTAIRQMDKTECTRFKKKYIEDDKGILFLFSGRITVLKGIDRLLMAWSKHILQYPADRLVVIGDGELYENLVKQYRMDSVFLEGKVDYNSVFRYYAIADVFVLPTLIDNWSLVIPEAMACGLPVATSIYNGCHVELVHNGVNGCTFDTYNQDSILKALDFFHHHDLKAMGQKSIEIEKNFDTEHCAKRLYDAIMKK